MNCDYKTATGRDLYLLTVQAMGLGMVRECNNTYRLTMTERFSNSAAMFYQFMPMLSPFTATSFEDAWNKKMVSGASIIPHFEHPGAQLRLLSWAQMRWSAVNLNLTKTETTCQIVDAERFFEAIKAKWVISPAMPGFNEEVFKCTSIGFSEKPNDILIALCRAICAAHDAEKGDARP